MSSHHYFLKRCIIDNTNIFKIDSFWILLPFAIILDFILFPRNILYSDDYSLC